MSISLLLALIINWCTSTNRTVFSNSRATPTHDGYMSFETESIFPLQLMWKYSGKCAYNGGPTIPIVFTGAELFCVQQIYDNDGSKSRKQIASINVITHEINWETTVYNSTNNKTRSGWFIISYTNKLLSAIDVRNMHYFMLDDKTGQVITHYSLAPIIYNDTNSINTNVAITGDIDNNLIYMGWVDPEGGTPTQPTQLITHEYGVIIINGSNGNINNYTTLNYSLVPDRWPRSQQPTLCNYILIYFDQLGIVAFNINSSSVIWKNQPINGAYNNAPPALCINDKAILAYYPYNNTDEAYWVLHDIVTGDIINVFEWSCDGAVTYSQCMPVVNVDKNILIRLKFNMWSNGVVQLIASDISNILSWKQLWSINMDYMYTTSISLIMVNEYVFLGVQGEDNIVESSLYAFDINNGSKVWLETLPLQREATPVSIIPAFNYDNNEATFIAYRPIPYGTELFAFVHADY